MAKSAIIGLPTQTVDVPNTLVPVGSISRPVLAKLRDIPNVMDYGAKCDAVRNSSGVWTGTDDTEAINRALLAVGSFGDGPVTSNLFYNGQGTLYENLPQGVIEFPVGAQSLISGVIDVPPGVWLYLKGSTIVQTDPASDGVRCEWKDGTTRFYGSSGSIVSDGAIIFGGPTSGVGQSTGHALRLRFAVNSIFSNLRLQDFGYGLTEEEVQYSHFVGLKTPNNRVNHYVTASVENLSQDLCSIDNLYERCDFSDARDYNIWIQKAINVLHKECKSNLRTGARAAWVLGALPAGDDSGLGLWTDTSKTNQRLKFEGCSVETMAHPTSNSLIHIGEQTLGAKIYDLDIQENFTRSQGWFRWIKTAGSDIYLRDPRAPVTIANPGNANDIGVIELVTGGLHVHWSQGVNENDLKRYVVNSDGTVAFGFNVHITASLYNARTFLPSITSTGPEAEAVLVDSEKLGDAKKRFTVDHGGAMTWGNGAQDADVTLQRSASKTLSTNAVLKVGSICPTPLVDADVPNYYTYPPGLTDANGTPILGAMAASDKYLFRVNSTGHIVRIPWQTMANDTPGSQPGQSGALS